MKFLRYATPQRAIRHWLLACCTLVFCMVLLGGITRLTGSGLSMVDWQPVTGWLPPLGESAWEEVFGAYRNSPEFRSVNFWMEIEDFKQIFWLEFLHRLLGRIIGIVYLIPFLWFTIRYRLSAWLQTRLAFLLILGGVQGLLGWYMVKSGLVDEATVSHYMLAAHLGLAVIIYGIMLSTVVALGPTANKGVPPKWAGGFTALIFVTMIWGAFLSGLDGGTIFNTFPLMDGHFIPPDALLNLPVWTNLFENVVLVQFIHRVFAMLSLGAAMWLWWRYRSTHMFALHLVALFAALQFCLGVATILSGASIYIAWAHQAGGIGLFSAAVLLWAGRAKPSDA